MLTDYAEVLRQARRFGSPSLFLGYGFSAGVIPELPEALSRLSTAGPAASTEDSLTVLIRRLLDVHPKLPKCITNEGYVAARTFLAPYPSIFTIDPCLPLHWARNKDELGPKSFEKRDGFLGLAWRGQDAVDQEVHCLHGGLHLYDGEEEVKKLAYKKGGKTIMQQVRSRLDKGKDPLLVLDPTSEGRAHRIDNHPYLSYCFDCWQGQSTAVVFVGHDFADHDAHLITGLSKSAVKKVFVSLEGAPGSDQFVAQMAKALRQLDFLERSKVVFFPFDSVPIWQLGTEN